MVEQKQGNSAPRRQDEMVGTLKGFIDAHMLSCKNSFK